jgi:hypothetical protein
VTFSLDFFSSPGLNEQFNQRQFVCDCWLAKIRFAGAWQQQTARWIDFARVCVDLFLFFTVCVFVMKS